ncbi:MAG TPA: oligosaccharide flippase family protein [Solirubrobacteraceae bacterium]|jgi:O-antigen/teichoic acid export membrane protein
MNSGHMLRLGRQTLVYGLSGGVLQLLAVLTLPIVARELTTAQYGVLELATSTLAVVGTLAELGLTSASQRSYYDYGNEQSGERRVVLTTAGLTYLASIVAATAILVLLRVPLASFLFNDRDDGRLVVLAAASLPMTAAATFTREVMRLHFRAWHYLASSVAGGVAGGAFIAIGLLVLHMKVDGVLLSTVIAGGVASLYGLAVIRGDVGGRVSRAELRTMFAYGLPLVPTALALWALALIDRIMLSKLSNLSQVGEYAMANRIGLVLTLAATAFATAYSPFMLSLYAEDPEEEKRARAKALTYMSLGFGLLTLLVSLFARELLELVAPRFSSAYEAIGMVSFGLAVNGIANIAVGGITLARETRSLLYFSGAAAIVNIALNFALIPAWGMLGAAFATVVAYLLLFGFYYRKAQRVYHTPYDLPRLLRLGALTAAATAVGAIPIDPLGLALAIKCSVVVFFLLGLRLTNVLGSEDLAVIRATVRTRFAG